MRKHILILYLALFSFLMKGQFDKNEDPFIPNIIPSSPEASSFSKYGNLEMSSFTGAFSHQIPLYTIKEGTIHLPIAISYSTLGVKVDEIASSVGLGWSLNAGGVINRSVYDRPDEYQDKVWRIPVDEMNSKLNNPTNYDYLSQIKPILKDIQSSFEWGSAQGLDILDNEQDRFTFNFNGYSGHFFIENNKIYISSETNGIKANMSYQDTLEGRVITFTFYDPKGVKYIFGSSKEYIEHTEVTTDCNRNYELVAPTSWFLKTIEDPSGSRITFEYLNYHQHNPISITENVVYIGSQSSCNNKIFCEQSLDSSDSKLIKKINFSSGSLVFDYTSDRLDADGKILNYISIYNTQEEKIKSIELKHSYSSNTSGSIGNSRKTITDQMKKRLFLDKLILDTNKHYEFKYNERNDLPFRLSFSKDYYGYHNGEKNADLVTPENFKHYFGEVYYERLKNIFSLNSNRETNKNYLDKGILEEIIYPTGGTTKIVYEPNQTFEEVVSRKYREKVMSSSVNRDCEWPDRENGTTSHNDQQEFVFTSTNQTFIYELKSFVDFCPDVDIVDLHDVVTFKIIDVQTGNVIHNPAINPGDSVLPKKVDIALGREYKVILSTSTKFNRVRATVDISYNSYLDSKEEILYNGGLRVHSIHDLTEGKIYHYKKYYYNSLDHIADASSSIVANSIRNYIYSTDQKRVYCDGFSGVKHTFSSEYLYDNLNRKGSPHTYQYITVKEGTNDSDNLVTEYQYDVITSAPKPNIFDLTSCYKFPKSPVMDCENHKTSVPNQDDWRNGKLLQTTIFKNKEGIYKKLQQNNLKYKVLNSQRFDNYTFKDVAFYDQAINSCDENVLHTPSKDYLSLYDHTMQQVDINHYYNYIYNHGIENKITQDYFYTDSGALQNTITTQTDYTYNNPSHQQVTKITVSTSKGEVIETSYQYAHDKGDTRLITENRIGIPLQTTVKKGGTTLSDQLTKYGAYGELYLPQYIFSKKGASVTETATDRRLTYDRYDAQGNLLQYHTEDGLYTSILWGYNGQYPIAKVEGARYDEISGYANNPSGLRTALPNAMVTTYTYEPLVGVTSITAPNGQTQTFTYDEFNRLWQVKDHKGKIIKAYEYHYENQE